MPEYNDNSKVKREGRPFTSASGTVRIRTLAPLLWVKSLIQQAMTVFFHRLYPAIRLGGVWYRSQASWPPIPIASNAKERGTDHHTNECRVN